MYYRNGLAGWIIPLCLGFCIPAHFCRAAPSAGFSWVLSDFEQNRLLVLDSDDRPVCAVKTIGGAPNAVWSNDRHLIAFKWIGDIDGHRMQAPCLFSPETHETEWLHRPVPLAGDPQFSSDGRVMFTIDNMLHILTLDGGKPVSSSRAVRRLPAYCNTISIHPEADRVALTDSQDHLYTIDLQTGNIQYISGAENACYPDWSPDGKLLAFRTIYGHLYQVRDNEVTSVMTEPVRDYCWLPGTSDIVASVPLMTNDRIDRHVLVKHRSHGLSERVFEVSGRHLTAPAVMPDGVTIRMIEPDQKQVYFIDLMTGQYRVFYDPFSGISAPAPEIEFPRVEPESLVRDDRDIVTIRGVPYQHQVYCTPAGFSGHWACNGTSAVMALAYYGILNPWNFVASTPFSHTSHWGRYVSDIYAYNGMTFNISSPDPNGNPAYGAYGFIVQNDWEDTKTHMKEYIQYHGVSSSVDWSPDWAELQDKTAARRPFVLLSSITSSGHYKTVVGYVAGYHTVYFNDPYGNKNQGYMNFNGAGVVYDWPGYNNGNANLNNVWCYIYADSTPPPDPPGVNDTPILIDSFPFVDVNSTRSSSGQDIFNFYNCAATVDESGREIVYLLPVNEPGTLNVSVTCDQDTDIDIHLLSSPSASSCLVRGHLSFSYHIATSGNYYITCDTFTDAGNVELMGDYTLSVTFNPDATPVPTETPSPTPTRTPSPTPTATMTAGPTSTATGTPAIPVPVSGKAGVVILLLLMGGALLFSDLIRR
ncbi:C39 family peptidase [bacterium]|nr:C39 family peptidase [candidate division CSSED10-310 bacterium]